MTATHRKQDPATERRYDEYYERYGKPLEQDHRGKYLAVSPKGDTLLGDSLLDVAQKAQETFGVDTFIYKVGEKAVGRLTMTHQRIRSAQAHANLSPEHADELASEAVHAVRATKRI